MSAPNRKSPYTAKVNGVRVPVVHDGPGRFAVIWREYAGAPRKRERFRALAAAKSRADEIARAIANGQADALTLTAASRDEWRLVHAEAADMGQTPLAAVREHRAALSLVPCGHTLRQAIESYAATVAAATRALACPESSQVVTDLMHTLRDDPYRHRDPRYLETLRRYLDTVAAAFPALPESTPDAAARFLLGLRTRTGSSVSAKTRDHFLGAARQLFGHAHRRGWLPSGPHAFSHLATVFRPGAVATFSLAEIREILRVASPEWIPFLAIGAFAGLRVSEIGRLTWDAIRWAENEIAVDMAVAKKTRRGRNVPLEPNLRAWLLSHARSAGRIYNFPTEGAFKSAVSLKVYTPLADALAFQWKHNAMRHSYGSYLYGRERNLATVRACMGNSEQQVLRFYNSPKTREEGAAWFTLAPTAGIIPLPIPAAG